MNANEIMGDQIATQSSESVRDLIAANWPLINRAMDQSEDDAITLSFSVKVRNSDGFLNINTKFSSGLKFKDEDERAIALNQEELGL